MLVAAPWYCAAIRLASVSPESNSECGIFVSPPITCVTAIASPTARPMPRRTAATRPPRVNGTITPRTISQRVSPRPYAPSFSSGGTLLKSSRLTLAVIGMIMIVRMMIAVNMAPPPGPRRPEERNEAERGMEEGLDMVVQERAEHEDPPEAEDDARYSGEHLDQGPDHTPSGRRCELGEVERDRNRKRTGNQGGAEGRDGGAVEEVERAELARDRVPILVPDEREAEKLDGRPGACDPPVNR